MAGFCIFKDSLEGKTLMPLVSSLFQTHHGESGYEIDDGVNIGFNGGGLQD
jgi:hypothetical protein